MTKDRFPFFKTILGKLTIGVLISFLLLIPMSMVENLVHERQSLHEQVITEISRDWGGRQVLKGPFLEIPYQYYSLHKNPPPTPDSKTLVRGVAIFLPEDLNIKGDIKHEFKKRGIYDFLVYLGKFDISGTFIRPDKEQLKLIDKNLTLPMLQWHEARVRFFTTDIKGLTNKVEVDWNGEMYPVKPANGQDRVNNYSVGYEGFFAEINMDSIQESNFNFSLNLKGSQMLGFIPLGKFSQIEIKSDWPSPKFLGQYLPNNHQISDSGFVSQWSISQLNRPLPQQWKHETTPNMEPYVFGVKLLETVGKYHKSLRATKYAILFILLSFIALFFIELSSKLENNLLQYILTGLALVLFYSILLSLTEQMSFDLAYLISTIAVIGLISAYNYSLTKKMKSTLILFSLWSVLYGFLFFILQLEELALLAGNIGLFIILAVIMFASKKLSIKSVVTKEKSSSESYYKDKEDLL